MFQRILIDDNVSGKMKLYTNEEGDEISECLEEYTVSFIV